MEVPSSQMLMRKFPLDPVKNGVNCYILPYLYAYLFPMLAFRLVDSSNLVLGVEYK
jgi:hypothetical protein